MFTVQTCVHTKNVLYYIFTLQKQEAFTNAFALENTSKFTRQIFSYCHILYIYKKSNSTIEEKTTGFPNSKNLKLFGQSKSFSQNLLFLRSVHELSWYMCTKVYICPTMSLSMFRYKLYYSFYVVAMQKSYNFVIIDI